jgi:pimeloyl-ACP methyl ester carboxylesterase
MADVESFKNAGTRISLQTRLGANHSLWVRTFGSPNGPNILFLHGFPTSGLDWAGIVPACTHHHCIVPDLLGYGQSDKPVTRYAYYIQADLIESLLKFMGVRNATIIAHDYSVTLAQELLLREQSGSLGFEIDQVVFLNGGVYAKQHRPQPIQRLLLLPFVGPFVARRMSSQSLKSGLRRVSGRPGRWKDSDVKVHFAAIAQNAGLSRLPSLLHYIADRKREGQKWEGAMENARDKISFIWGTADPVSGLHVIEHVRSQIPTARISAFPDVGHYPQWEAPEETIAALRSILKSPL